MAIRVVLAEDNYLLRAGTAALLDALDGVELVAAVGDADELLAAVAEHRPDVVLTDIRMPPENGTDGLKAAAVIRARYPGTGVVLLTQYADPQYAYELLRDGATGAGYLLKERIGDVAELERSLQQVASGGSALDPVLVEALVNRKRRSDDGSPLAELTNREREVLEQMAQGKSNAAIAEALVLTKRAVEKHINSIFLKLDLAFAEDVSKRVKATLLFLAEEESASLS
jgi:DNA-binding NarL/FixJ family response regulator